MIPIDQQKFSSHTDSTKKGDCLSACIASIFEIPLETVPLWSAMPVQDWGENFRDFIESSGYEWVGEKFYSQAARAQYTESEFWDKVKAISPGVDGYYVISGTSPRGFQAGHAVIYKDGKLAHDPHPSREGVGYIWAVYLIHKRLPEELNTSHDDDTTNTRS
jgi:hypothetical protein